MQIKFGFQSQIKVDSIILYDDIVYILIQF